MKIRPGGLELKAVKKFARGLYYHHHRVVVPNEDMVSVLFYDLSYPIDGKTEKWITISPEVIRYSMLVEGMDTSFVMEFHRNVVIVCIVALGRDS
jgi:hypothetical protein